MVGRDAERRLLGGGDGIGAVDPKWHLLDLGMQLRIAFSGISGRGGQPGR